MYRSWISYCEKNIKKDADRTLQKTAREHEIGQLDGYIDIYMGTHAMTKNMHYRQKYLEPGLKRRCHKWCGDFNYANRAIELITGENEKFQP